jgi:hypothetical protein
MLERMRNVVNDREFRRSSAELLSKRGGPRPGVRKIIDAVERCHASKKRMPNASRMFLEILDRRFDDLS